MLQPCSEADRGTARGKERERARARERERERERVRMGGRSVRRMTSEGDTEQGLIMERLGVSSAGEKRGRGLGEKEGGGRRWGSE